MSLRTSAAFALPLLLMAAAACAAGQNAVTQNQTQSSIMNTLPTADFGFNLPSRLGTLTYSLTASEFVQTGQGGGSYASTAGSGNFAYLSKNETNPFSIVYSGGYIYSHSSQGGSNSTFQDLALSQVYRTKSWDFILSDAVSFLPTSPTTGLSGVAGVGDIGVYPVTGGLEPDQSILTYYGRRIANGLSGSATWEMTGKTDLDGNASWQTMRFIGSSNPGLNNDSESGSFGINHRLNTLNSVSVDAYYSRMTYPDYGGADIESEGVNVVYNRTWSRAISTTVSAGPEISHGTGFSNSSAALALEGFGDFPATTNFAVSATANYAGRRIGGYISYTRGVDAGSGVLFGALTNTVSVGASRPIGRNWLFGLNAAYSYNASLVQQNNVRVTVSSVFGGAQLSRKLTEDLSFYMSYTGEDQSYDNLGSGVNALNGINNIATVGITFSPAPLHRAR